MPFIKFTRVVLTLALSLSGFAAHAMSISGTPAATVVAGQEYRFEPTVKDANFGELQFKYINKPNWSKGYRGSGLIRGVPTTPGVYENIQIVASDGSHYAFLPPFTITVTAGAAPTAPTAPTDNLAIHGTPQTAVVLGHFYSFTPTVVANSGAQLKFSVAHLPGWATFNAATGAVSGTPSSAQTDANVTVSVTDGTKTAALAAFDIDVSPSMGGSVSAGIAYLTWIKPTLNRDGSPLTNLTGYVVRYGTSAASLDKQLKVGTASTTEVEIENLAAGTWYFEIAAINDDNVTSTFSAMVSNRIQ